MEILREPDGAPKGRHQHGFPPGWFAGNRWLNGGHIAQPVRPQKIGFVVRCDCGDVFEVIRNGDWGEFVRVGLWRRRQLRKEGVDV